MADEAKTEMHEVKKFREPARARVHCGEPMKAMRSPSVSTGELVTIWVCKCGAQERER